MKVGIFQTNIKWSILEGDIRSKMLHYFVLVGIFQTGTLEIPFRSIGKNDIIWLKNNKV